MKDFFKRNFLSLLALFLALFALVRTYYNSNKIVKCLELCTATQEMLVTNLDNINRNIEGINLHLDVYDELINSNSIYFYGVGKVEQEFNKYPNNNKKSLKPTK